MAPRDEILPVFCAREYCGHLARAIGCKLVEPCRPEVANRHSGYLVGGTSPFGTRKAMPVYMEETILDEPLIYINGGARGFLVAIAAADLVRVLEPIPVRIDIGRAKPADAHAGR